ncbi:hypothetical protein CDD80_4167 [Ophiocordyceps camponoti-rufipedis]|uniref:Uncharacterized protein n=1 Tax=Ophiocordyceps camponoti-rufipedis TaxID=2004952 RepID=A0A2C5YZA8_9HYPO|nr:hypothetical protein CDD80_4167 [Ophiocordyceps camponoti-rufipedis]
MRRSSLAAILNPLVVSQLLWPHLCHAAPKLKLPWINVEEPGRASESYHVGNSNFFVRPASYPRPAVLTEVRISKQTPSGKENKDESNDDDDLSFSSPPPPPPTRTKDISRGSRMLSGPLKVPTYKTPWKAAKRGPRQDAATAGVKEPTTPSAPGTSSPARRSPNRPSPTRSLSQDYATVKSANLRNQPVKSSLYGDGTARKVVPPTPPETFDSNWQKPKRRSSDASSNRISAFYGADDPEHSNRFLDWLRNRSPSSPQKSRSRKELSSFKAPEPDDETRGSHTAPPRSGERSGRLNIESPGRSPQNIPHNESALSSTILEQPARDATLSKNKSLYAIISKDHTYEEIDESRMSTKSQSPRSSYQGETAPPPLPPWNTQFPSAHRALSESRPASPGLTFLDQLRQKVNDGASSRRPVTVPDPRDLHTSSSGTADGDYMRMDGHRITAGDRAFSDPSHLFSARQQLRQKLNERASSSRHANDAVPDEVGIRSPESTEDGYLRMDGRKAFGGNRVVSDPSPMFSTRLPARPAKSGVGIRPASHPGVTNGEYEPVGDPNALKYGRRPLETEPLYPASSDLSSGPSQEPPYFGSVPCGVCFIPGAASKEAASQLVCLEDWH